MDIEVASILWNRSARPLIDRPQYEIGKERRGERNFCLPFFCWSALLDLIVVPRAGGALSCSEFRLPGP